MTKRTFLHLLIILVSAPLIFILGCETRPCLEPEVLGEFIDTVALMDLYEGPEEDGYLLVHPGWRPLDTVSDISALTDRHPELLQVPGVIGFGTGLCGGGTGEACIHLMLGYHTLTPEQLARMLSVVFADEWLNCFGINVELMGYAEPRCEEGPDCLPVWMCTDYSPPCCWTVPDFDPEGERISAIEAGSGMEHLELPERDDECTYDGECVLNGCGNHCNAYTTPGFISTCECYTPLADTLCGCVEGRCRWFRQ